MTHYTFDGSKLFRKLPRAADWCLKKDENPFNLSILVEGKVELAPRHEVIELLKFMYPDYRPSAGDAYGWLFECPEAA